VEDCLAGLVALEDGPGAAGEGEGVGEEFAELVVGAAFEGGGVDFYLQRITEPADDRAAPRGALGWALMGRVREVTEVLVFYCARERGTYPLGCLLLPVRRSTGLIWAFAPCAASKSFLSHSQISAMQ